MAESKVEIETSSEDVEKYCDACMKDGETQIAVVYCKNCKQFQCTVCNRMHRRISVLNGHVVVDVNDTTAAKSEFDMQGIDICGKHEKKLKFHCKVDGELCCSTCAICSHLKCGDVGEIDKVSDSNYDKISTLQTGFMDLLFKSDVMMSTFPRMKTNLRNKQEDKLHEIDIIRDSVTQLFDTLKEEFKSKTDTAISEMCQSVDLELTTCKQLDENIRRVNAFLRDVVKEGTHGQVFTAIQVHNKQVGQFGTRLEQILPKMSTFNINVNFHEKLVKFVEKTDKIATISMEKIGVFTPMEPSIVVSVDLLATGDEREQPFYSGIDVLADGRIVGVDNSNYKCIVMDGQLSVLGVTKLRKKPFDVAAIADNKVALSHGTQISLHTVNEDHKLSHIRTFQTKASYDAIYAFDEDTLVASSYKCDKPAKLVTLTGEEKDFDFPFPPKVYKHEQSKTTYIPSLDILVLTDREAHKCFLWNVKDKTSIAVEDERMKEPNGVYATSSGIICVCSSATHSIVQISPIGKVIGSFRLAIKWPYSVAVSPDDKKLLVFNSQPGQRTLQLFKLK